ncbi:formylglycine-generating enzyme family protein [Xenorhabdus japonica]|uniref:Formylglycine-generating enzyme, required for sulfatase activity, contains SUMF1/FGE domain n=1 Tax=Xenorhabdus japonica TaxID=53341 RepID=A0A1I5BLS7_9GAMM|nr:SUMF1/EgtB/PvdO family nonheme iron enzyme [Xenorhabdus japonica]SFN75431.1 Formylglycine-generating enzyme, required for sulfatase activity, contains SUMF1/FGE domain [Xenorhabdus japonica]
MKFIVLFLSIVMSVKSYSFNEIKFSFVEGGDFYVGNVFGVQDYESNFNVKLDSFYIMKNEVTYSLYKEIYEWAILNGYEFDDGCNGASYEDCLPSEQDNGKHPVTNIEWLDTIIFSNALSEKSNLNPVYLQKGNEIIKKKKELNIYINKKANGYRLPTLNEWHVAARGGKPALRLGRYGYYHSGSNDPKKVAWYPEFNLNHFGTQIVGKLSPNDLGLYDMSGNVSEWIYHIYDFNGTKMYYFCGGSYLSHSKSLSSCDMHSSNYFLPDVGFRLVRSYLNEN